MAHKNPIINKTLAVGSSTLLSRILGIIRELLMVRYLGAGAVSDAFLTAFKIPNSLRKIFAEGALSSALVPSLVSLAKKNHSQHGINQLLSLAFLIFEGVVLLLCVISMIFAKQVIMIVAPGFSPDQVAYAAPFLQILMPLIFFISSSAILAGALQAVRHFFIPAFSSVILNIFFIAGLVTGIFLGTSVETLCYFILLGGLAQLIMHAVAFSRLGFSFALFDASTVHECKKVLKKFVPCLFSMSVAEVGLFLDTSFASYLPEGSVTLLYYGNRFMGIPSGVFAAALSTVLLPYLSHLGAYAPKRLSFYLLEITKLVFWVTIPTTIIMGFFADKIFYTLFYSKNFSMEQVLEARAILIAFLIGLFFLSMNKILMNIYYALHNTTKPAIIAVIATVANIILNFILMQRMQAVGLALATTLSNILQTVLFVWVLYKYFGFKVYLRQFMSFAKNYSVQMFVIFAPFFVIYMGMLNAFEYAASPSIAHYALNTVFFWMWTGPLVAIAAFLLYRTRKRFNVTMYFLS